MVIYSGYLTFRLPTKQQVALNDNLVKVIQEHHRKSRENLFHLCIIAYGLRTHNLIKSKSGSGGNAKGLVYKPAFSDWYQRNSIDDIYGSPSNFTLYAMAGRLLNYVRWQVGEKCVDQLPGSMTALYALSQIVWLQGDKATDASRKLFEKALYEPIQNGSKNSAFIHPHVSRKDIDVWREKYSAKSSTKSKGLTIVKADPRTIVIATIKVHKDLFKFTRDSGKKLNGPKLTDVKTLTEKLENLIIEFDAGKSRFSLDSHFVEISREYKKAESPDFGKNILVKGKSKPIIAKKPIGKKV